MLKEKLHEVEVLEIHLKDENLTLRDRIVELRVNKKAIKRRGVFYYRKGHQWYREACKLA